jgi:hypothetical protein
MATIEISGMHDDDEDEELTPAQIAFIDRELEAIRRGDPGIVYNSEEFRRRFGL